MSDLYSAAQDIFSRIKPERGGCVDNGLRIIWAKTIHGLFIYEYFASSGIWSNSTSFPIDVPYPNINRQMVMSNLKSMCHVDTTKAIAAAAAGKSAQEVIEELVKALEAAGHVVEMGKKPEDIKTQRKRDGVCPECGDRGKWVMMGLFCPIHGQFAG